jgi:cyclase
MLRKRIIPCLLLSQAGLVKTRKFCNPVYVGDPINTIKLFNDKLADELMILDIDATSSRYGPQWGMIENFASEAFMPLSYGGSVNTCEQIQRLLGIGIEKVVLHSAALANLNFVTEAVKQFGSSTIVVCINTKKSLFNKNSVWMRSGKPAYSDPVQLSRSLVDAGVGELLIQSVDRDGMMCGYDLSILKLVTEAVSVPVVACGGASSMDDVRIVFREAGVAAAAAGSIFTFQGSHRAVMVSYPRPEEIDLL